jgi:hypothetical protein
MVTKSIINRALHSKVIGEYSLVKALVYNLKEQLRKCTFMTPLPTGLTNYARANSRFYTNINKELTGFESQALAYMIISIQTTTLSATLTAGHGSEIFHLVVEFLHAIGERTLMYASHSLEHEMKRIEDAISFLKQRGYYIADFSGIHILMKFQKHANTLN